MRLRSSRGDDANDGAPHGVADEERTAVDHADRAEAQFADGIKIIELDDVRVQENPRCRRKIDSMLPSVGLFLGVVPFEVHHQTPISGILKFSTNRKARSRTRVMHFGAAKGTDKPFDAHAWLDAHSGNDRTAGAIAPRRLTDMESRSTPIPHPTLPACAG